MVRTRFAAAVETRDLERVNQVIQEALDMGIGKDEFSRIVEQVTSHDPDGEKRPWKKDGGKGEAHS